MVTPNKLDLKNKTLYDSEAKLTPKASESKFTPKSKPQIQLEPTL